MALWTPAQFGANLTAHYDAQVSASITESGGAVSAWASQVGGWSAVQATENLKPAYSATGWDGVLPAISGDGSATIGDYLQSTGPFAAEQHVWVVAERATQNDSATSSGRTIYGSALSSGGAITSAIVVRPTADAGQTQFLTTSGGAGTVNSVATSFANGAKAVLYAKFKDNDLRAQVNGGTVAAAGDVGATTATATFILGDTVTVVRRFAGKIAEIVVINTAPTEAEKRIVEGYLAHRWNITSVLDVGHPYKLVAPKAAFAAPSIEGQFQPGAGLQFQVMRSPYHGYSVSLFDRMTTPPTAAYAHDVDVAVRALIGAGLWAKRDHIWGFAAPSEQASLLDWKSLSNMVEIGAATFAADDGWSGDGSNYIEAIGAFTQFTQNDASLSVYSLTEAQADAGVGIYSDTTTESYIFTRSVSDLGGARVNAASTNTSGAVTDGRGLFTGNRTSSVLTTAYRNNVSIGTVATASAAIGANAKPYAAASAVVCAFMSLGISADATDRANELAIIQAYLTGRGAI